MSVESTNSFKFYTITTWKSVLAEETSFKKELHLVVLMVATVAVFPFLLLMEAARAIYYYLDSGDGVAFWATRKTAKLEAVFLANEPEKINRWFSEADPQGEKELLSYSQKAYLNGRNILARKIAETILRNFEVSNRCYNCDLQLSQLLGETGLFYYGERGVPLLPIHFINWAYSSIGRAFARTGWGENYEIRFRGQNGGPLVLIKKKSS